MALMIMTFYVYIVMFFKQKTAYEMLISDWSSDVCSSDLPLVRQVIAGIDHAQIRRGQVVGQPGGGDQGFALEIDHRCLPLPSAAPSRAGSLRLSSVEQDVDAPVLAALVLDLADPHAADLAGAAHVGSAAALQVDTRWSCARVGTESVGRVCSRV